MRLLMRAQPGTDASQASSHFKKGKVLWSDETAGLAYVEPDEGGELESKRQAGWTRIAAVSEPMDAATLLEMDPICFLEAALWGKNNL